MLHSPTSCIERYLRGTWTKHLICLKGILKFLLTRIVSKEEWFVWQTQFGNHADRIVMFLFYAGSIIYIEDFFFSQKKKKRAKLWTACRTTWVVVRWVFCKEKKNNRSVDEHETSSQIDQNAYQKCNSSIKGISPLISHSFYYKWQQ